MADCSKCLRTDVKCCFTCRKDADKCKVWHHCGSDCPNHEAKVITNADKIRAMDDEELAEYIFGVSIGNAPCVLCSEECDFCELSDEECKSRTLKYLQSEAE